MTDRVESGLAIHHDRACPAATGRLPRHRLLQPATIRI
jgi:hypothetical protein